MIDCISVENMRLSDAHTISNLVPSLELMHRAAYGVFKAASWSGNTAIVVGSGNNGGDGFALACILKEHNYDCTVFTVSQRLSADSAYYAEKAASAGVSIRPFEPGCLAGYNIVVDCLLGTGFQGQLRENYRTAIEAINASSAYVVSVDINSGMNGDTGNAELAVRSDLTVTIGYVKRGLISENAGGYMKRLVCADIGIVLVKKEWKICSNQETLEEGCFRCPAWLDMHPIQTM
ncbi:MAG: NAD(P)H-hydrate epimerase [Acetatifactor sp.]